MSAFQTTFTSIKPSQEVEDLVIKARIQMIMNAPFFGHLVMNLIPVYVPDDHPRFKTLATDGRHLLINGGFMKSLQPKEQVFGIGHEVMHVIMEHSGSDGRRLDRDPGLWNIAADHVSNLALIESGIGERITSNGFEIYADRKYLTWSAEQVYEDIKGKDEKCKGEGGDVLDEHLESGSVTQTGEDSDGNPVYGVYAEGMVPPNVQRDVESETRSSVMSAARAVQGAGGKVPAGVLRKIDEWLDPAIDWRNLLASSVSDMFTDDYSYMRPSKKSWAVGAILPGPREGETVHLAAGLDMSGSIGQKEATAFLSELWGIMQSYSNYEIDVWCYDTAVYNHQKFTPENVDELRDYLVKGGGGTLFEANYVYMEQIDLVPHQFVNFTDGHPNASWGDPDYCDAVFVITDKRVKPPFGRHAYFDL